MSAERRTRPGPSGEGIKLSSEVKLVVPKHAEATVAWSEPSEACAFPRYLTTCYPLVREPSLDNILGDPAFREYSSCSYSPDVVANAYPVAGSQYLCNNSTHSNGSGIVSESAEQTYLIRKESKTHSKQMRPKESEKRTDKKRHDGDESSVRNANKTSYQTSACSRDPMKPDKFNNTTNKKSTQTPKTESLPVPAFETAILDFHKSQSLESNENAQHRSGRVCSAGTNISCLSQPQVSFWLNTQSDSSAESKASTKTSDETVASLIPSSFDGRDGSAQPYVSWAMVLSQPPKKIVSSPVPEGLSRGKGKQDSKMKESETKNDASETELEEGSEKKKKKKKKKKKTKSPTDVEKPQNESVIIQEPPRIEDAEEFPDLAAASDRRNRLGSQKSSFTPAVRKQSEIHLTEEPWDTWSPTVDGVPKVDGLSGKQASSSVLERKKMQIILKEREQRKQQHLLVQTAVPKEEDNSICKSAENIIEDKMLPPDGHAAVPVTQVAEGFLENTGVEESTKPSMTSKQPTSNLPKIHSRNFRDYCSQVLSKEVDSCVTDLLKELVRFQDRLYQKDPVKAKIKRRLVMGLREVLKHLKLKKLKCVIISPNCEKIQSKGGLDETLHNIIDCACEQNIPFVFALNRKALGRCLNKAVPVSVVGIFSYDGAQDHFHRMVQLTTEARKAYKDMIAALEQEAEGGPTETQPSVLTTEYEKNGLLETGKTSSRDSDEDVPNYIKIWRRKLEEEYNPYALELEESAAASEFTVTVSEHQ
ncbi:selenocysteine insertion sequence-binding protein 2 isoform X4 [Neopsephotus bourkii]|uniref:selenocysteine insertion sequence-binding protein 2 isoform X4 n=1 Tax=Neopsephotus bourkii TaxID=309878 RepID=UPI002AA523EC|nr:selenocysteine insertion sequence-binding protein 2 isoform X4 [Neopsephotus bourkii]